MKKFLWGLMTLLALSIAGYGWLLVFGGDAIDNPGMAHHFSERPAAVYLHFAFGPLALAVGAFQFLGVVRSRWPGLHRWAGRIYVLSCVLSGIGGGWLALNTSSTGVAMAGFLALAAAWEVTTIRAFLLARGKRFKDHRRWMIYSYALTYAAVTLRLYIPLSLGVLGLSFSTAYPVIAWACWVPNLLVALIIAPPVARKIAPAAA